MARHITAKKQLTRERALSIIDFQISVHLKTGDWMESQGHGRVNEDIKAGALQRVRDEIVWACEHGVFPPTK